MKSLHVRARVDAQGTLTLSLPPDMAGQEVELIAVFEPVGAAKPGAAPAEEAEWPPGFFEQTAGAWRGEPLKREAQGELEERETRWDEVFA